MKNSNFKTVIILIVITSALILSILWIFLKPDELVYQGRIEVKEVYLSAKINSRINTLKVDEGDHVKPGQLLATLESPEIDAKELQAIAASEAALALKTKALNGARYEEINAARSIHEKAKAASVVMQKTYTRINNLFNDGVISEQEKDEVFAKKEAAIRDEQAAYNQYLIAISASRKEDIAAAKAKEKQAKGALQEIKSYKNEQEIKSNIDGEVLEILPEQGELIGAGYPIVHLVDLKSAYVVLNIKETELSKFKKGSVFEAVVPALANATVTFKVYYVSALGDFATWNATKTKGDFDLRTFEIKARPVDKNTDLRPGMSVLVDDKQFNN